eukprot:Phypoly_transcript_05833.p1 GENE.Phypoly_transcript_05833~~Phypoly_transcript_05833.p1  ORF type:complete len:541 (+),score=101.09 Phypoly_transcript_05833:161-1783(+)
MTRPCERCVRVGEAHLCVDLPRKRRGKHAHQPPTHQVSLEPHPPAIPALPSDDSLAPIDEISDFLFDGIENHLLADNTLRNVSRMEGSALTANSLLRSRPLFSNGPTSHYGVPSTTTTTTTSTPSPTYTSSSSSSGTPSPVPTSPYSPTSDNLSPSQYLQQLNGYTNYTPDAATYSINQNVNNLQTINIRPDNSLPFNNDYQFNISANTTYASTTQEYHPTDEALINAHISSLISNHTQPSTTIPLTPTTIPLTPTATSIWTDPAFAASLTPDPDIDNRSQSPTISPSNFEASPNNFVHDVPNLEGPNIGNGSTLVSPTASSGPKPEVPTAPSGPNPSLAAIVARLSGMDAAGIAGSNFCSNSESACNLPQCFCNKSNTGKVHVVCAEGDHDNSLVENSRPSAGAPNSLHLVVESLVREVQSLKREMRGDPGQNESAPKIGKVGFSTTGPAVAVWDLVDQRLLECNETFATLFCVDPTQPLYLTDIAQCPAYFLRLCAANKTSWHEKRRYSLKRPEGDINLVIAIDINGTCVVTTVWKAE